MNASSVAGRNGRIPTVLPISASFVGLNEHPYQREVYRAMPTVTRIRRSDRRNLTIPSGHPHRHRSQENGRKGRRVRRTVPLFPPPTAAISLPDIRRDNQPPVLVHTSSRKDQSPLQSVSSGFGSGGTGLDISLLSINLRPHSAVSLTGPRPGPPTAFTETRYCSTVFQVRLDGLRSLTDVVRKEIEMTGVREGMVIACCELKWTVPEEYRDKEAETRMKKELMRALLISVNNRRGPHGSVTEERVWKRKGVVSGAYRRYYQALTDTAHVDTAREHSQTWTFQPNSPWDHTIDWPLLDHPTRTTAVMLNTIQVQQL